MSDNISSSSINEINQSEVSDDISTDAEENLVKVEIPNKNSDNEKVNNLSDSEDTSPPRELAKVEVPTLIENLDRVEIPNKNSDNEKVNNLSGSENTSLPKELAKVEVPTLIETKREIPYDHLIIILNMAEAGESHFNFRDIKVAIIRYVEYVKNRFEAKNSPWKTLEVGGVYGGEYYLYLFLQLDESIPSQSIDNEYQNFRTEFMSINNQVGNYLSESLMAFLDGYSKKLKNRSFEPKKVVLVTSKDILSYYDEIQTKQQFTDLELFFHVIEVFDLGIEKTQLKHVADQHQAILLDNLPIPENSSAIQFSTFFSKSSDNPFRNFLETPRNLD